MCLVGRCGTYAFHHVSLPRMCSPPRQGHGEGLSGQPIGATKRPKRSAVARAGLIRAHEGPRPGPELKAEKRMLPAMCDCQLLAGSSGSSRVSGVSVKCAIIRWRSFYIFYTRHDDSQSVVTFGDPRPNKQ